MQIQVEGAVPQRRARGRKDLKGHGFDLQAKRIIRDELIRTGVSHEDLVKRLARMGVHENVLNLRNKLARGRFTASFLLQVMAALGVKTIDLEEAERNTIGPT
ncbi:hypothetical protein SAQ01S_11320 [Sphingomonas aquatilis NBRC 16722]|uniref:DUF6471 domain-containing protein n=1 Tax=Sphingomonas aquatilis TaxID=93063 RepID=A0AAW3TT69_9SPHN|nr:DUF6471 domain-containing protein [Sphingomonas aquatilis]MBB3875886.1 hypothetical protein [Sphingomonas aquatilis]GEM71366.1 hypothetical protein SAQ01S_11320 [Sphingomonas aquatilis NBRC 16722]